MTNQDPKDQVLKALQDLEKLLGRYEATPAQEAAQCNTEPPLSSRLETNTGPDYNPEERVLKALQDLEEVLPHYEATHAVVVIYNSQDGKSHLYGTFTGLKEMLRVSEVLARSAALMREQIGRQVQ